MSVRSSEPAVARNVSNHLDKVIGAAILVLGLLLVFVAILSLRWNMQHDAPILFYITFLIDQGKVPYGEIFDMNMPGTYLAYYLIGSITRYNDLAVRFMDLSILFFIGFFIWLWMKKIDNRAAWLGSIIWGLSYLGMGPQMSLQREYILLLPLTAGILLSTHRIHEFHFWRLIAAGFCFGLAASIKPHSILGFPVILLFQFLETRNNQINLSTHLRRFLLPMTVGLLLPLTVIAIWLIAIGGSRSFIEIALNYWPLYTNLTGDHTTMTAGSRMIYLIRQFRTLGGFETWLASAVIGAYFAMYVAADDPSKKRQVGCLLLLAMAYAVYPVLAGQFWAYHWLLFFFFLIQLSALCVARTSSDQNISKRLFPAAVLVFVMLIALPIGAYVSMPSRETQSKRQERVVQLTEFLNTNLKTGETVQPLDWTGGAVHALLESKSMIATPFVYDFHFYHHVSNPYIQEIRRRFINDLKSSKPRYVFQVTDEDKPWVSGEDTTREFPELQSILDDNYNAIHRGDGFVIYEIKSQ